MSRDDIETAYFTLLRAREELEAVRRYEEYLAEEARRIRRFEREGDALADTVAPRLRRLLRQTDEPMQSALKARLSLIEDELARVPDRESAAAAFVEQCEHEHARLRGTS